MGKLAAEPNRGLIDTPSDHIYKKNNFLSSLNQPSLVVALKWVPTDDNLFFSGLTTGASSSVDVN